MKKLFSTLLLTLVTVSLSFAADLVVQEGGAIGTYSSIGSAITAAVDGDRIIIHPKIGGNAWVEDLTINKSLELISSQDAVKYILQGDINVIGQSGRKVTIIGVEITSGEIVGVTSGAWETEVNVLSCKLHGGRISFSGSFKATVVSNILLNGYIQINSGSVIGNELLDGHVTVLGTDTTNIIANKMSYFITYSTGAVNLRNNFIYNNNTQSNFYSIRIASVPSFIQVVNNTVGTPSSFYSTLGYRNYFIYDYSISGFNNLLIQNNIFVRTTSSSGSPAFDSGLINGPAASSYNYYFNVLNNNTISTSSTEITLTSNPINNTGNLVLATLAEDGANPAFEFYDLDLSIGDAGCYGGSYSLDNYFPIVGSSRVFNIDMPFGIISTGTLDIKATGFDR